MTYQHFTAVLLLTYGSLFLSGIYYCPCVFWCATARMSELELEQRTNIKFLVKLGKSGNKIREMLLQVYGDNAMKKTVGETFFWGKRKCHWQRLIRIANNKHNWRKQCKSSSNCSENLRLTLRSIAEQVNIDRETVRKILTEDLDMRKGCAKMVPKELTEEQKQRRVFSY